MVSTTLLLAALLWTTPSIQAGLTVDIHTYRYPGYFVTYGWLSTNSTAPAAPFGNYQISSPNGSFLQYTYDNTGLNYITGGGTGTSDFTSFMNALTNGQWSIQVTNASSTNTYFFTVSASGLTSGLFNTPTVTAPANNAQNVSNDPTFTWTGGPSGWAGTLQPTVHDPDYNYYASATIPATSTSWQTSNPPLPNGTNIFGIVYLTNLTASVIASTPLNGGLNPISGWVSTASLDVNSAEVEFVVGQGGAFEAFLVARYNFENPGSPGNDTSGNGNHNNCTGSSGGSPIPDTASTNAAVGTFARQFFGDTSICFTEGGSAFPNLSNAISGSFTVTAWVKTTSSVGSDNDDAYWGMPIWYADGTGANYTEPLSITGSKAAFTVYDGNGDPTTVHSTTSVNNGTYHFIAVTRNQATGLMSMYVDGVLEATATGTTAALEPATYFDLAGGNDHYTGLVDDLRIYSTNLTAGNIAALFGTPSGNSLADSLDGAGLIWTTGGNAPWFSQTTTTHDTVDAAQSGAIGNNQSSWVQTTVTGPGTLEFWWNVDSDDNISYDYLEFTIDGNYESEIAGSWGWDSYWIELGPGSHTLRWTYWKDSSDTAGTDAGFLDEVSFTPFTAPVITFQPIDQTTYPGYGAHLVADATSYPEADWQWYKVGVGAIPGAVNRHYAPTNTSAAAGSYYAIASNSAGPANTRTAVVSFVSAPLPPDWTKAFQVQLLGNFNQPRTNYGIASLVDASGNVYSANSFTATNTFGTNTFAAGPGRFASGLFKQTANGIAIWGRAITNNGNGNSYPQSLAKAPGDGVYMSGVFLGTNYIGTNVLQESAGASIYLARFDSAGNVLWLRTFGGTNGTFHTYHQLTSDPAGNVTIAAIGNNWVNFGTTNIVLAGQNGVLAQYDANGNLRWIEKPSGWVHYLIYDAGRMYAAFGGSETNYIGGITNTSDRKFALAALNATNGQAFWVRGIASASGSGNPNGRSDDNPTIAVSGSDLFVTGTGWGASAQFGPHTVSWPTPNGQYFARYDTNGTAQLAVPFGGTNLWPWASVADASGNVYLTGDFNGYASFGNKTIGAARYGGIDPGFYGQMFLAKFDRTGSSLWVRQAQSETQNSFLNVRDLSLASDGVWVCGFVNDQAQFGTNAANTVYGPVTCIGSPFCFLYYWTGGYLAKVTEAGVVAPALPVTLLNPQYPGSTFQFQFLSQAGKTNIVQSRTNLTTGTWLDRTNILGDGNTKTVVLPVSGAPTEFFRISTQ